MQSIKSFTDLPQSKKLAEILPLESADMVYVYTVDLEGDEHYNIDFRNNQPLFEDDISAWSLAALLEQLPYEVVDDEGGSMYLSMNKDDDMYQLIYSDRYEDYDSIETDRYEHFVDACYEIIIKLKEMDLL